MNEPRDTTSLDHVAQASNTVSFSTQMRPGAALRLGLRLVRDAIVRGLQRRYVVIDMEMGETDGQRTAL